MIYLDNAATSLIKPVTVERAVRRAMSAMASPGRGGHKPAMLAAETVYKCREAAAELFSTDAPESVVFTMNATHALNIAIDSLVRENTRVLVSGFEHNSVTRPLTALNAKIMVAGRKLFDREAVLNDFADKIKHVDVAVCTYVSNVFGFILPIYDIACLCREHFVPLIVDASQAAGVLPVNFKKLGAEFVAMPGHKGLFGPQGTGILLSGDRGRPLIHGGSGSDSSLQHMPEYLPDRLEAGTHNVCGIAGLLAGIEYVKQTGTEKILAHEQSLLQQAVRELSGIEGLELFTGDRKCQSGVLSVRSSKLDCESLAAALAEQNICVRAGLHCAPYAHKSAGTFDSGTVRLSFSPFTDESHIHTAAEAIKQIIYNF
ncbi:MAG: aminotransferase class V-fold PLP-dependent enzyme [Candidatus Limivicinus sp.]|jgi:cysteine desulfurase family protein